MVGVCLANVTHAAYVAEPEQTTPTRTRPQGNTAAWLQVKAATTPKKRIHEKSMGTDVPVLAAKALAAQRWAASGRARRRRLQ